MDIDQADEKPETGVTNDRHHLEIARTMQQLFRQAQASEQLLLTIQAQVAGAMAVVSVVDENQTQADVARHIATQKELITFLYEKNHQYVTVIIGGAFAAYFATLSIMSARFSDQELLASALLMTLSLTVFVLWEITSITFIGWQTIRGSFGSASQAPRWQRVGWAAAMFLSLATALPAIGLSIWVYLRGLGVVSLVRHLVVKI